MSQLQFVREVVSELVDWSTLKIKLYMLICNSRTNVRPSTTEKVEDHSDDDCNSEVA